MRVLFVDDEPRILDGLRDLLRKQRHRWTMEFVLGGEAALQALGAQSSLETWRGLVADLRRATRDS